MLRSFTALSKPLKRKPTGLTLLELLAVIAILAILAVLIYPTVAASRAKANTTKCLANLRQIGAAAAMYSVENNSKILPPFDHSDSTNPFSKTLWPYHLAKYLGHTSTNALARYDEIPVYMCPEVPDSFGYGHNYNWLFKSYGGTLTEKASMNLAVHPGSTVLMTDLYHKPTATWRAYVRPAGWATWKSKDNYTVDFRHSGETCNVLWLDGHVSSERPNTRFTSGTHELWKLYPDQVLEPGLHNQPPN